MKKINTKISAIFMIILVLIIPFYTSTVFAQDGQTVNDKTPPSINIKEPPEEATELSLNIEGTTNEPIKIETKINSEYYNTANSNEDNTFKIPLTLEEGENKIEINATDAGGNSVLKEFSVFCDSQPPQIMYNNIYELSPSYIAKRTIKGTINKPDIDIQVYVDDKKYTGKSDSEKNADGLYTFEVDIKLERTIYIDGEGTVTTQEDNAWENPIKIIAIDKQGRNTSVEGTIIYTLCGYGSDWDVRTTDIKPEVIIPEHLIQGIAQFSFSANLSYRGNADPNKVIITSQPQITRYELSQADTQEKKGLILKEKYYQEIFNSANAYCNEDNDKCYFVVNLNSWPYSKQELQNITFIKIPLRMDIYYEYEDINGDIVENSQRNCWEIKVMVDKEIPLDKIPKNLLNSSIKLLNKSINVIDAIKKPVDTAKKVAFVGCVGSWIFHYIKAASVEFSCVGVKEEAVNALINGDETCPAKPSTDGEGNPIELDCDACLQNLKDLRQFEKTRNWICDRIFCPSVPTLEYHKRTYKDSITNENLCNGVEGMEGMFGEDSEECEEEYKRAWDSAFMTLDEWERANAEEGERNQSFFDKISEGLQFCKKQSQTNSTVITLGSGTRQEIYIIGKDGEVRMASDPAKIEGDAITEGNGVLVQEGGETVYYTYESGEPLKIDEKGYYIYEDKEGASRFYEEDGDIYVCTKEICDNEENKKDITRLEEGTELYIDERGEIQRFDKLTDKEKEELKNKEGFETFKQANNLYVDNNGNIKVYNEDYTRESDIKKLPSIVQSKRGIEGQNNYILDPTSDFVRSVQAVCLPAVSSWLNLWKQMLTAVKQCFETIMITGQGSAGVCKAVLTTYVCDIIYDAIRCATESFSLGAGEEASAGLVGIAQKLSTAGKTVSDSVSSRYGNTGMYDVMFNQRKVIHSACLFAFTGDWGQFDLDTMLSTEVGALSVGSQGLLYPTTRRFINSNPLNYGRTTYVYHIGAGIIAGSELNYKVYLKCSNDNSCPDGRCDCFYKGQEDIHNLESGSLKPGEIYNEEYYLEQPDWPVRYDKAVIEWNWIDNNNQRQTETIVKDLTKKGEGAPEECKLDSKSGEFRCSYIVGKYGEARFVDIYPAYERDLDYDPYSRDEEIIFNVQAEVKSPEGEQQIPKYVKWSLRNSKNKELYKDQYKISKEGITEEKVPNIEVEDICCGSASDQNKVFEKFEEYPELEIEIEDRPDEYMQFLIITEGNYFKAYKVTKDDGWTIQREDGKDQVIDEGVYEKGKEIEFNDVKIKINSEIEEDKNEEGYEKAAVVVLKKIVKAEDCIEGKEDIHLKLELFHSKTTEGDEGECCAKRIETEDIKFTVDCTEHDDEEENGEEEDNS